jgi:hypothetical protein
MKAVHWLRPLLAGLLSGAALGAYAAVAPGTDLSNGNFNNIAYGALSDGNVFALRALLYPEGDGLATQQVLTRANTINLKLDQLGIGPTGAGTSLEVFSYSVTNKDTVAHDGLRFMVALGVDGNPNTLLESVAETWGAAAPGEPSRRQTIDWDGTPANALDNVWTSSTNGPSAPEGTGVPAACTAPSVCDTYVGLAWDIKTFNPGDSFLVRVGLSDNGQHLSSRFLRITADPSGGISNVLTFSGTVEVVPEASTLAMLLAGLALVGVAMRRRVTAALG